MQNLLPAQPYAKAPPALEKKFLERKNSEQARKILRIVLACLTLGLAPLVNFIVKRFKAKIINPIFMPAIFKPKHDLHADRIPIETIDGVTLDARAIHFPLPTPKWIVYFCPNAGLYEEVMDGAELIAGEIGANVLLFNYRECGNSEGQLINPKQELTLDGVAVMQHLKEKMGVAEKDILLLGHSQGGGVAPNVAMHYPEARIISDRSYATIADVVGSFASVLAKWATQATNYNINAIKSWMKIPDAQKAIVYHPKDGVVKYKSSLYFAVKTLIKKMNPAATLKIENGKIGLLDAFKPNRIKLTYPGQDGVENHCYFPRGKERREIVNMARRLLNLDN